METFNTARGNESEQDKPQNPSPAAVTGASEPRRGFAAMDPEKQRAIASKGGRAAHDKGRAHEFSADEARVAGKKGGDRVSADREHMVEIGKKGGQRVSRDREWMARIGKKGGEVVSENREHMTEIGKRGGSAKRNSA